MLIGLVAVTQAAEQRDQVAPPPPLPADSATATAPDDQPTEPEVHITTKGSKTFEEYRYHGQLYMIKVTPSHGPPYYLIYDENGDFHRSDAEPKVLIPYWVIKRF